MDGKRPDLRVVPGLGAAPASVAAAARNEIASPEPASNLGRDERAVWDYICQLFREAGVEHMTAGLAIEMIWTLNVCDLHNCRNKI